MLDQIIAIVKEAGGIVLAAHDIAAQTHEKSSAADLVTEYDLAVENFLKERLPPLLPGSIFYGEDVTEEQAQRAEEIFSKACPNAEVTLLAGGQPIYYYMISAE